MKRLYRLLLLFAVLGTIVSGCEQDIADADYPEQTVYLPLSRGGIYTVNDTTAPGNPFGRYLLDVENSQLLIPIGIYRSGIDCSGAVTVDLEANNDTVQALIDGGGFVQSGKTPEIMPVEAYSFPASVTIEPGKDYAVFNLAIELPFIQANLSKRYALAIRIAGSSKQVSEQYNTAVIDFDARFVGAAPRFSYKATKEDPKVIAFTNLTTYGLSYEWDFGNGQKSTAKSPEAQTYPGYGTYSVSLKSVGIDGKENLYMQNVIIWNVITDNYIKNPGDPFKRANVVTSGRTDVIADWDCTPNVLSTVSGGKNIGGWMGDANGVMDFYANASTAPNGLTNAKIYQSFELEAGHYQFGFVQYAITGVNNCYAVVYSGTGLPDIENIDADTNVLGKFNWDETASLGDEKQSIEFDLDSKQTVTTGFVVTNEVRARLKIKSVSLAK
jgi:PKD repeat protein